MNFRVKPETKELLKKAAEASGSTVSAEIEHQLERALFDMPPGPAHALFRGLTSAIDTLIRTHNSPRLEQWLNDPVQFDRVVRAFTAALEMFRPEGPVSEAEEDIDNVRGRYVVRGLFDEILRVGPSSKQPLRQRRLAVLKKDLDEVATRPRVQELISLAQQAQNNPEDTNAAKAYWRLTAEYLNVLRAENLTPGRPVIDSPALTTNPSSEEK
jgi:hypothetical protein